MNRVRSLIGLTAWVVAAVMGGIASAKPPQPAEHTYRPIAELDQKLQRTWTRRDYIEAYRHSPLAAELEASLAKNQRRKHALGRGPFFDLATLAVLYQEVSDERYFDLLRRALLHESAYPSNDIQFGLCRMAACYQAIRGRLQGTERKAIEGILAAHADQCLSKESGTEMNRGVMNTLGLLYTAKLLPEHPRRGQWESTARRNWQLGLLRIHDNNEDSIGYNQLWLYYMMLAVAELEPDPAAFYRQPWVKDIFQRHLQIRTPLGNEPQNTAGALTEMGLSIAPLEWAGKIYHDGRFRWAAQRTLNLLRAQPGRESYMPDEPLFAYVDDTVRPVPPEAASYYSHRRYEREYPNKFVLRSGYGPDATFLAMNLFHGGGHGLADGSTIYCLMDRYGLLLSGGHRYANTEENSNILLVRRQSDPFPFGDFAGPDRWLRMHVDLRTANTAVGNLNIEWSCVNNLGFRLEREGTAIGSVQLARVVAMGSSGPKVLLDRPVSFSASQQWLHFPLEYPLNLAAYDALEVLWKHSSAIKPEQITLFANSDKPQATARWYPFLCHNWRSSRVRFFADFPQAHVASVQVDLYDYTGANHRQYRDIVMLPNKLIWVRDTLVLDGHDELQAGPLWHVYKLEAQGDHWFQTSTHTTANFASGNEVEAGPPRDLLIAFAPRQGMLTRDEFQQHTLNGRPHCVFQKWQGKAAPGRRVAFDSFLIPNDARSSPSLLAAQVRVLHEDDDAAVVRYGQGLLIDNPEGHTVRSGDLETDYRLAVILLDGKDRPVGVYGLNGSTCRYAGRSLHELPESQLRQYAPRD